MKFHYSKMRAARGFTLIELLVVIAIIGLLASVVLASLNSARAKGADSAIKADLRQLQSQAAIVYDNASPNSYNTVCNATQDTVIAAILVHAQNATGAASVDTAVANAGAATKVTCHSSASNFAIGVPLKTNSANAWCVDDSGAAKQITTTALAANAVACP